MPYQPLNINKEYIQMLLKKPKSAEEVYKSLDLNGVERCCVDRLLYIYQDMENSQYIEPTILDLGCSGGFFSMSLALLNAKNVIGIDDDRYIDIQGEDSASSIANAKERLLSTPIRNLQFIDTSVEKYVELNYFQKRFDIILCLNILHHFYKGYGNITQQGRLDYEAYTNLIIKIGQMTNKAMYFETESTYFGNYERALLEILNYGNFSGINYVGFSPAANGELRILWKFMK